MYRTLPLMVWAHERPETRHHAVTKRMTKNRLARPARQNPNARIFIEDLVKINKTQAASLVHKFRRQFFPWEGGIVVLTRRCFFPLARLLFRRVVSCGQSAGPKGVSYHGALFRFRKWVFFVAVLTDASSSCR